MTKPANRGRMKQYPHSVSSMTGEASLFDQEGNRKYLNTEERLKFYEMAKLIPERRHRSFCLTLYYTGCRISEALELHRRGLDHSNKMVIFRTLKQRRKDRYRALPIPDELIHELDSQIRLGTNTEHIWNFSRSTGWRIVKKIMKQSGLGGVKATPKGLRHGFAVACITAQIPMPTLQKWMGHSRFETTTIYLDFVGKDERDLAKKLWA